MCPGPVLLPREWGAAAAPSPWQPPSFPASPSEVVGAGGGVGVGEGAGPLGAAAGHLGGRKGEGVSGLG